MIAILMLATALGTMAGCSKTGETDHRPEHITVKGSDTMLRLVGNWVESFVQSHPHIEISVSDGGSEVGIEALLNGDTDICASSLKMSDAEIKLAGEKGVTPREFIVAWDGIAVIVNPENPVDELTTEKLAEIFTGGIRRWDEVGGAADQIKIICRPITSGTHIFFKKQVLQMRDYPDVAIEKSTNENVVQFVSTNKSAIGYAGLSYALTAKDKGNVKIIAVKAMDNATAMLPSKQTIALHKYFITRPLYLYINGQTTGAAKKFIDFCLSPKGQTIVLKTKYLNAESSMDTETITSMIFCVVGGVGIFLLGMKNMSEGMQAVAGNKLRSLINAVTNNRLIACGIGTMITCLIQSSSVTTVMVVGMVNAGLMNLMQAIGVILGANIGTTITAWILVLNVSKYGLPLLGISAFGFLFSKRDRIRYTASIFMGLGMVFYGLELMKNGFAPLQDVSEFQAWFARFSPDSYLGVLRCCLVGTLVTAIVQSSSATVGITMGLAFTGVIDFPTAAALVLGENIGTTITAVLASLGASTNAKRAAYAHTIFNLLGVMWITLIFFPYIEFVQDTVRFAGKHFGLNPDAPYIGSCIALTHTGFNITNAIIFMPLMGFLSKLLYWLFPDKPVEEAPRLTYLNIRMLDTPALGIQQSQREVIKMGQQVREMLDLLRALITSQQPDKQNEEKIFKYENALDIIQKEIVEFLGKVMSGNIAHSVMDQGRRQLRMADEYESISDYITNILKLNLKMRNNDQTISGEGLADLTDLHDQVTSYIDLIYEAVRLENGDILNKAETHGENITLLMKKYRSSHLSRVGTGTTTPLKSLFYTDMLNAYRRIKDHALNIAEVLAGEK